MDTVGIRQSFRLRLRVYWYIYTIGEYMIKYTESLGEANIPFHIHTRSGLSKINHANVYIFIINI